MRKPLRALFGLLLAGSLTAQTTPPLGITIKTPELQAFINARIHTSPAEVLDSATLVIDRGKIVAVGRKVTIPSGAVTIDLEGKTIYPGFIDPFSDYGLRLPDPPKRKPGEPFIYEASRVGCNAWNEAIHAETNWGDHFVPDRDRAEKLNRLGFTSAQSARLDGVFRGRAFVTSLGDGLPNDLVIRPRSRHFLSFDKGSSLQEYPESQMGAMALIRQTLLDAGWYEQAHAAYRLNPSQPRPEFNSALEALQGVTGETVLFDLPDLLAIFRADRLAREFALTAIVLGSGYEYERVRELKATGRTLIVPLDFPDPPELDKPHGELDVSLTDLRRWDRAPSNPAILEQNKVRFAFTTSRLKETDEFLDNVRRAVQYGLSEETALAALTTVPAEICGVGDLTGTLQPGKLADFIVCDGNIFDEKTSVCAAYNQGRKREFIPFDEVSFDGLFVGELLGRRIELKVEDGRRDGRRRISGKLVADTTEVEISHEGFDHNRLSFAADLAPFGGDGIARFALRRENQTLVGEVTYADGRSDEWLVTRPKDRIKATPDGADGPKRRGSDGGDDRPVSRLTRPNMAFGSDTLPTPQTVLVRNATIWTCDSSGILENADMLVRDGRIEALGRSLNAPSGCTVIDATGKCVAPGIIDEHSHMGVADDINEGSHSIVAEVRIADVVDPDDIGIYRSLAGGVTAARILHGSSNPIGGQTETIKLRWGADAEGLKMAGAPPAIKFALGENVRQAWLTDRPAVRYPQSRMGVETIMRDAFQTAREYEAEMSAYRKLNAQQRERTVPPRRNLRLEALVEVLHSRLPIACHAYVQSEMLMMMRLAEQYGIKLQTFVHVLEGYKVADEMARHGVGGASAPDWWAYKFEVYDAIAQNPGLLHQKGVVTSINSDSPNLQRLLNQAAAKSIMYTGMSPEEALKMVTLNPARQMGLDGRIGSLKVGKDADFAIWSGNPLSVYSKCEQTWIDGRKYFDLADDLRRRADLAEERNLLIQKVLSQPERKRWKGDETDGGGKYPPDGGVED